MAIGLGVFKALNWSVFLTYMDKRIPLSEPIISGKEWKYIKECLDTGWVSTAGKFVDQFALAFKDYVGSAHAVPTQSGTAGLHVALLVLGLQPNEEVLVPTLTFVATANVVRYCSAYPVFIDIEPNYLTLDVGKVKSFLEQQCVAKDGALWNKTSGRRIRGLIPVHLYGHPTDMDPLLEIAQQYNLFIVEDATEAVGSKYKGKSVGTIGNIGVYSFNGNKMITTGGGGMVVTQNKLLAEEIQHLTTQVKSPGLEYHHTEIGYNYRLTNIQAALGLAQLEQLPNFLEKRRAISKFYRNQLSTVDGIRVQQDADWAFNDCWLSWILVEKKYPKTRAELLALLNEKNIQARPFFIPLHILPPYKGCQTYHIENAIEAYNMGLNLPSHAALTHTDLQIITNTISFP